MTTEFTWPAPVEPDPTLTVPDLLAARVARGTSLPLIEKPGGLGRTWIPVTAGQFADEVRLVARGLIASGLAAGDRVAIMSRTRYEWTLLDFACWAAGLVPVPVYETSSPEQVRWIASDAGVRFAVVETAALAAVVAEVRADLPGLADVLVIDQGGIEELERRGASVPAEQVDERTAALDGEALATVIYTSGTTGRPKGVELTHRNFAQHARNGAVDLAVICDVPHARTVLFLPLAHVFARYIEVVAIAGGSVLGHCPDTRTLVADLGTFKPSWVLAVPRVFEKLYNSAEQKAGTGVKLKLFRWAAKVAITYSRALDTDAGPSAALRTQHRVADRLVHRKVREALGGHAEFAISGGAPLGERLGHFYRGIGVTILEGYGLTETAAPTTVNRPGLTKVGSVGPAFPGTSVKVDDAGQIWVKGPHVFRGYRHMAEDTEEVLDDGWFLTGDLGTLDEDGYLRITGRSKEIIVTAGGKNVAPALLEDRLRGHPLVSQVVVVGDQRPFIGALVTLDAEMLPGWLSMHGLPAMDVTAAAANHRVLEALDRAVVRANEVVSRAESIRKVRVLTTDFTVENGYLTPSLKVKRALVLKDFARDIDELYVDTRAEG